MKIGSVDRRLLTILLVVFVQMLGASLILPVLPLYAQREFRMSAEMITLLTSSFYAAQFIAAPRIGRLSDHYWDCCRPPLPCTGKRCCSRARVGR